MRKNRLHLLLISTSFALSSCALPRGVERRGLVENSDPIPTSLANGGFEASVLSGWEIEYGDAFDDGAISSTKTFSYSYDAKHTEIPISQTGNWYLTGKGFDGSYSHGRTGAIRSEHFILSGNGFISMKLAGGAITRGKGDAAEYKNDAEVCYVGIYTAKDEKLVARVTNEYFLEHTESYVDLNKYTNGVYSTDNFTEYSVDLYDHIGEEMYIRIVDNDRDVYYGYLAVDDIRIGGEDAQPEGAYYVKSRDYRDDIASPSPYEIKNGGFETGSLAGWQVLEGQAFSNDGVNHEKTWWNENITYDRDGEYHYGQYKPSATGKMRSSTFVLGGSGYVSFKLGGCSRNDLTYLSFYVVDGESAREVARYSNRKYWNFQFPFVPNGMKLLNMVQYVADLHEYLGKQMYVVAVDENLSDDELGCMTLDSVVTYYSEKPGFYNVDHYQAISMLTPDIEIESEYQVLNGTFEKGDLTGWETSWESESDRIGRVSAEAGWWNEGFPYNKKGDYLFTGVSDEANTGYLKSSTFKVGGIGKMSFLLGGAHDPRLCYISLMDADTDEELARFGNRYFHDLGTGLLNQGSNLLNMVQYVADISKFDGEDVYLKVVDNATSDWGLLAVDSFITYYSAETALPTDAYEAKDILPGPTLGEENQYQVLNGDFETGDLTGWTFETDSGNFGGIEFDEVWWNEWYSFDKQGNYFFSGWKGSEDAIGALVSSSFTVGGANAMSFRLGGGKHGELAHVEVIDATTEEVLKTYTNYKFNDVMSRHYYYNGHPIDLAADDVYMANMVQYVADLSELEGREVKIRLVDNATSDWGLLFADDFVTYYADAAEVPAGFEAK